MNIGDLWAYRARGKDPLTPVRVVKLGTSRPPRVLVRFEDDSFEGREEWVPPARLKVLWASVEEFMAKEARWAAVTEPSPERDTPVLDAARVVFDELIDFDLASVGWNEAHMTVRDPVGLAEFLDIPVYDLHAEPSSFEDEDGHLIAPWPTTLRIAIRAAQRAPERILDYVDKEERKAQHEAIHGHSYQSRDPRLGFIEPDWLVEYDNEHGKPVRELLRLWCGETTVGRRDELAELRKEVRRLGAVVEDAISVLRRAGYQREADRIERELGTPVELLRQDTEGQPER